MMTRRTLLHLSAAGLAAGLVGCETSTPDPLLSATPVATARPPVPPIVEAVAGDRTRDLTLINASFEQLTGEDQLWAFGLVGPDNAPVREAEVEIWVGDRDGEPALGPFPTTFREVPNQPLGLYTTRFDVPVPGDIPVVAVTADGGAGHTVLRVADPEGAAVPAPGTEAISVATPTTDELMGFERLCTLDPPCGMHEVSLDDALADGRPVVLTIATPAFCETAICGPTVEVVETVRTGGAVPDDVAWIHLEVFTDSGATLADQVAAWQLPSEPWIFGIDADGTISGRLDGPLTVLPEEISALARDAA